MKCEKCNEREATFYYSSNWGGEKTERHLCADCARAEGFGGVLERSPAAMFDDAFEGFFADFFAPVGSIFPSFAHFGSPIRSIMAPAFPRVSIRASRPQTESHAAEESEAKIPDSAGEDVCRRREKDALKAQLAAAVEREDFEQAITLRDRIREMEQ